jgi:hypothetical protein
VRLGSRLLRAPRGRGLLLVLLRGRGVGPVATADSAVASISKQEGPPLLDPKAR